MKINSKKIILINSYFDFFQLDDHSAAITAVRFSFNSADKQLYVISCGSDKSVMIRTDANSNTADQMSSSSTSSSSSSSSSPNFSTNTAQPSASQPQFVRTSYVAEKQTFYDLNIDSSKGLIHTISQDRMIRTYAIKDGKKLRQLRGSLNEDGYLIKMDTTGNGTLLATSCTDKCVYIWDLGSGECVAYIYGHSEVVQDLKFTSDSKRLITVSTDGCIFVWNLSGLPVANNGLCVPISLAPPPPLPPQKQPQPKQSPSGVRASLPSLDAIFDDALGKNPWSRAKLDLLTELNDNVFVTSPTPSQAWVLK